MTLCQKITGPHPRDGPWAWLVCFTGFLMNLFFLGLAVSSGVFLLPLSKEFKISRGATAWIFSLTLGMIFLPGPLSVRIVERFGERMVGLLSGLTATALILASSFARRVELLYIFYGCLLGVCGCCLVSAVSRGLQKYFKKHIGLASGITTSGGSMGVLMLTPALQALIDGFGWRWAMRVSSGAVLLVAISFLSIDPNVEAENNQRNTENQLNCASFFHCWDCSAWRNLKFTIGAVTLFLNFFCLYVPVIHMITFANDLHIPASKSSLLFIYIGGCSTVSRIIIGKVVDRGWLSALQCIQLSSLIIGLSMIMFSKAKVYAHFVVLAICYSVGNGIFISTQYSFLLTCFSDMRKSYVGMSMCYTVVSIALISGAPIAGFISDAFKSYVPAFYIFGGVTILSGTLPFILLFRGPEKHSVVETKLKLIGSRLANAESSFVINMASL